MITIKLNDKTYELPENTDLATFISSLKISTQGIAVAINYTVIPKENWQATILKDKEELILIHAVAGG